MSKDFFDQWIERAKHYTEIIEQQQTKTKKMSSSGKIKAPIGTNRSNLRYYLFLIKNNLLKIRIVGRKCLSLIK